MKYNKTGMYHVFTFYIPETTKLYRNQNCGTVFLLHFYNKFLLLFTFCKKSDTIHQERKKLNILYGKEAKK